MMKPMWLSKENVRRQARLDNAGACGYSWAIIAHRLYFPMNAFPAHIFFLQMRFDNDYAALPALKEGSRR